LYYKKSRGVGEKYFTMKKIIYFFLIAQAVMFNSCSKEVISTKEKDKTPKTNYCTAELFYNSETDQIGVRVLDSGGGIDLDAHVQGKMVLTGVINYEECRYDYVDGKLTTYTVPVSSDCRWDEELFYGSSAILHSGKREELALSTYPKLVEAFNYPFRKTLTIIYPEPYTKIYYPDLTHVHFEGTIEFYRSAYQITSDKLKLTMAGKLDEISRLTLPVECKFELTMNKNVRLAPVPFSAIVNGEIVKYPDEQ
jgi:hypothetical protein